MPTGLQFLAQYSERIGQLFDVSVLPLKAVGGTGDVVTATLDPPLTGGLKAGMKFTLAWANANSGAMTLALNGGAAVPVLDADGAAMVTGAARAGQRALLEYVNGAFRALGGAGGSAGASRYSWRFTASGTWNKPSGLPPDTLVFVEAWGAGGGGGRGSAGQGYGGGGGGGYVSGHFRAADLAGAVSVTIGAGGAGGASNGTAGANGGNTTFGALLTAYGGRGASASGGGGAGEFSGTRGGGGAGGISGVSGGATVVNSGSPGAAVLDFGIPQGDKGDGG